MNFSVGNAFAGGWRVLRGRYLVLIEATVLYAIAQVVILIVQQIAGTGEETLSLRDALVQAFTTLGISIPAGAGFVWMGAAAHHPGAVPLSSFFVGYRRWTTLIAIWLLECAVLLAVLIPALVLSAFLGVGWGLQGGFDSIGGGSIGVASLAAIWIGSAVGAIWIATRLLFAQFVCVDPDAGAPGSLACLSESWSRTRGFAFPLYLMLGAIGFVTGLSALLLGVGLVLLGLPLATAVLGTAYHQLVSGPRAQPAPERPAHPHFETSSTPGL